MTKIRNIDAERLKELNDQKTIMRIKRDSIDDCFSDKWLDCHIEYQEACQKYNEEVKRLWKLNPWGQWMTKVLKQEAALGLINYR